MAGAFDGVTANRREALWDAGLPVRPPRNGQRAMPVSSGAASIPDLPTSPTKRKMAGEYTVMGIYPRGHVMEFVRPNLPSNVLCAADIDSLPEGEKCW